MKLFVRVLIYMAIWPLWLIAAFAATCQYAFNDKSWEENWNS